MFVQSNQRFLSIVALGVQAAAFSSMLHAQVQISGTATHYRSLNAHHTMGDERMTILGIGNDPDDGVTFMVCKTNDSPLCETNDLIHIYRHDTISNQWVFESSISHFGYISIDFVDVDGDTIALGRSFEFDFGNDGVDLYKREFGGAWVHETTLLPIPNVIGGYFGSSVSLDGDLLAVGAPRDDPDPTHTWEGPGSVSVYARIGGVWTFTDQITAFDGEQGDEFGEEVAIQATPAGWDLIVAAPDSSTDTGGINFAGAIYAYQNITGSPEQTDRIVLTTDQNTGGNFGRSGIGFDGSILAALDFDDLYLYETDPSGQLGLIASWPGTDFLAAPVVKNRKVIVGDPNGGLVLSNGQSNITLIEEAPSGTWTTTHFNRPPVFQDSDYYASAVDFDGNFFAAAAPLFNGAGQDAGAIWTQSIGTSAYPLGLLQEGLANQSSRFGFAMDATEEWAAISSSGSDNQCEPSATTGSVRIYRLLSDQWNQYETILPPLGTLGNSFGSAVAIDQSRMAIAMDGYQFTAQSPATGAVFIYEFIGFQWTHTQTLEYGNAGTGFGFSVDLDGDHLVVGMPDSPASGAAQLYHLDTNGMFQTIIGLGAGSATANARFGHAVSLWGDELLIGAPANQSDTGRVLSYHYDNASGSWQSNPELTVQNLVPGSSFGTSIVQTQDSALIGTPGDSSEPGRVAVFPRTLQGYAAPTSVFTPAGETLSGFGNSISANENKLLVGHADPSATKAHFMAFDGSTYHHLQTLSIPSGDAGAVFGKSFAIAAETLFIGAPSASQSQLASIGEVFLYETEIRFTVPECDMNMNSDYIQWIQDDAPEQGEWFAYSVEVDEGYAIVGAPYEKHTFTHDGTVIHGDNAGKATIFERTGLNEWTPVAYFRGGNFDDPIGVSHADWLGWSADIERTTAVAGATQGRYEQSPGTTGSIRVYERTPAGWIESGEIFPPGVTNPGNPIIHSYGSAVDLDTTANFIAVGAFNSRIGVTGTGAGFVLERTNAGWVSTEALVPPTVLFGDHIGKGASVEEGWAAFGAPDVDTNGGSSGAVHLFKRTGLGIWAFHSTIFPQNPQLSSGFGNTLEISRSDLGLTMVVGAFAERESNASSVGAGYVFVLDELNDQWNFSQRLLPEFTTSSVLYARDISIDHNTIAVGAPSLREAGAGSSVTGGVEVYNLDQTSGQFVRRTTIRPEQKQWNSPNGWGNAIGISGGTVLLGTSLADGERYDFANRNFNYGAVTAHDIICVPDCPADLNGDGVLDFFDVSAFLTAFASLNPNADLNGDGVIDFFDVSVFLAAFSAGC